MAWYGTIFKIRQVSKKLRWMRLAVGSVSSISALAMLSCYEPTQFELPELVVEDPFVTGSEIENFLGTSDVKVAFTLITEGKRRIFWTDFNQAQPGLNQIKVPEGKEHMDADSPLISPDGEWVAYFMTIGTEWEAYMQKLDTTSSPILISSPGSDPHWWRDPADNSLYIIYANSGDFIDMGTLENVTDGGTYKQQVDLSGEGEFIGEREMLVNKPFVGGLSVDGNFLATGYSDAAMYDLENDQFHLLNANRQVCNASASPDPDKPNWMLFLNFQGEQNMQGDTLGVVGQHDLIYFVDNTNTMRDFIRVPSETREWQDPEWSNHPLYVISLGGGLGNPQDVFIIDRSDKSLFKINNSENFTFDYTSTPSLWIGGAP